MTKTSAKGKPSSIMVSVDGDAGVDGDADSDVMMVIIAPIGG